MISTICSLAPGESRRRGRRGPPPGAADERPGPGRHRLAAVRGGSRALRNLPLSPASRRRRPGPGSVAGGPGGLGHRPGRTQRVLRIQRAAGAGVGASGVRTDARPRNLRLRAAVGPVGARAGWVPVIAWDPVPGECMTCGERVAPGRRFCRSCYQRVPGPLRRRLARTWGAHAAAERRAEKMPQARSRADRAAAARFAALADAVSAILARGPRRL